MVTSNGATPGLDHTRCISGEEYARLIVLDRARRKVFQSLWYNYHAILHGASKPLAKCERDLCSAAAEVLGVERGAKS